MKTFALSVAALLAASVSVPAMAQSYTGGSGTFTGLGADQGAFPGTPFDIVTLSSLAGTYTGPGAYDLNGVTFEVGVNRNDAGVFSGTLSGLTGTFAGNAFTYSVNYTITIGSSDTIVLGGNFFNVFGTSVYLKPLTFTTGVGEIGTGTLQAVVGGAVPEPATWAMMLMGFGMVGYGLRRRQGQVTTKVSFA